MQSLLHSQSQSTYKTIHLNIPGNGSKKVENNYCFVWIIRNSVCQTCSSLLVTFCHSAVGLFQLSNLNFHCLSLKHIAVELFPLVLVIVSLMLVYILLQWHSDGSVAGSVQVMSTRQQCPETSYRSLSTYQLSVQVTLPVFHLDWAAGLVSKK